jgi:hypothetical protein
MEDKMQQASLNHFIHLADIIKINYKNTVSNIFLDANKLHNIISIKDCYIYYVTNAVFLLIPQHNKYYDCLFIAQKSALYNIVSLFISTYNEEFPLRISIIGTEPSAKELAEIFENCGFILCKRLSRMRINGVAPEAVKKVTNNLSTNDVQFAEVKDAEEILNMLLDEFDMYGDNIPELSDIIDNIGMKQVLIIKKDGKIAALHYFQVQNGQHHAIYDLSRKEFRKDSLFLELTKFINSNIRPATRYYGWRDTANKRLMKLAKIYNEVPDGIYIYNMVFRNK